MPSPTVLLPLLLAASVAGTPLQPRQEIVTTTRTVSEPGATPYDWSAGAVTDFSIRDSCNSTLRAQLEKGLGDTIKLAHHAKEHLLRWGNESSFVQKYFGNGSTAGPIGWYERVINSDRAGIVFRCDDPDENCATQDGWAGHWRGDNATLETVICPLSFEIRRGLESVCGLGYTVSESKLNTFWGTDLMHRLFHVPKLSEGIVEHYADDYAEVLELAAHNASYSAVDSDTLQYFAIDVYAYDIAAPGVGCTGHAPADDHDHTGASASSAPASSASSASAPAPSAPAASTTDAPAVSGTSSAASECHTHADGTTHCV